MSPTGENPVGIGELAAPENAVVDIVFIHGLTGHREKTWTGRFSTFWPGSLLPGDIPNARILSWGYDADLLHFFNKRSNNALDDHSKQLCGDLAGVRTQKPDRPIIFVVHSLGGVALVLATLNAESHIKQIATNTKGIIFLGTPLRGSSKIKWADIGHKFAKLVKQDKNKDVVAALQEDSHRLQSLADAFANILRDRSKTDRNINVVFFYEQFATGPLGHIVTQESATVDGYEAQSLPADHSSMTKFDSKEEPGYIRIERILERWVADLQKTGNASNEARINITQNTKTMNGGFVVGMAENSSMTANSNMRNDDRN